MSSEPTAQAVEDLKNQGNEILRKGNIKGAIEKYTQALKLDPDAHVVLSNRSAALLRVGQEGAALEDALRAVQLAPTWPKAHLRVAAAYVEMGRLDEAEESVQAGLAIEPENLSLAAMMTSIATARVVARLKGQWHGTVAPEVGGYVQVFDFLDSKRVKIIVLGTEVEAQYELNVRGQPFPFLDMWVPTAADAPVIRHIYRFSSPDELHLCSPYLKPADERPSDFAGAGYVLMKRGPVVPTDEELAQRAAVSAMSEHDKLLEFLVRAAEAVPEDRPLPNDSDVEQSALLAANVRFQSVYFSLSERFGPEVDKQVKELVIKVTSPPTPQIAAALDDFRGKLERAGLLEPPQQHGDDEAAEIQALPSKPSPVDSILGESPPPKPKLEKRAAPAAPAPQDSSLLLWGLAAGALVLGAVLAVVWMGRAKGRD